MSSQMIAIPTESLRALADLLCCLCEQESEEPKEKPAQLSPYEPDKPTEPQKKSYVAWKDDDVVPATLDEAMDWIIENPNNDHNERTHGDWTTVIDFDVDDLGSGLPFALRIYNEHRVHSRICFPTFLDAVRAQTKFHKKLEAASKWKS